MKSVRLLLRYLNPFRLIRCLVDGVRRAALALANWRRRRFRRIDYVVLNLPPRMPALPERRGWWQRRLMGPPPLSLWELAETFRRIGDDPRITGVILSMRGLQMPLADLQTLRQAIQKLRGAGKRAVCFAHAYDTESYYVASAASDIVLQEVGELAAVGLYGQAIFLRDALDAIGLQLDVEAITPYKSAYDMFARRDISPEHRAMVNWLLDSQYDMLVEGIAAGRGLTPEAVRAMIDGAPYQGPAAREAGYVDAEFNEEGLAAYLGAEHLVPWETAVRVLLRKWQRRAEKAVAVLPLRGLIVEGESRQPPVDIPVPLLGESRLGHLTVVQQVRNLMKDRRAAAVVLFIDSGGGSASASEAMTSALAELAKDRPLVAAMNGLAGSGGYYIATPARWIVAQPGTRTGSIGVLAAKPVGGALLNNLRIHAVEFTRGANATFYSARALWSQTQRAQVRRLNESWYRQFVGHVARSRRMTLEAVEAVGGGRVWTGAQALEHGLVDQLGGLEAAIAKARELAALPDDAPVEFVRGKGQPLGPQLAEGANPAALWLYMRETLDLLFSGRALFLTPFIWE